MKDLTTLSPNAQALYAALDASAQNAAQARRVGYATLAADDLNLGPNAPVQEYYPNTDAGLLAYEAKAKAHNECPIWAAIRELREAGHEIVVSAGDSMRYVQNPRRVMRASVA